MLYTWDFFKNNYKTQTISLVSKRFKLISFITIQVQWTRFRKNMEIEFHELGFDVQKLSSLNSFSMNSAPIGLLQNGLDQMSLSNHAQSVRLLANEFIELVFIELSSHGFAWSSSAEDHWLRLQIVQFLVVKNKFKELVFYTWKRSSLNSWKTRSLNSFSIHGKRVQWTRFPCMENEFFARSANAANDLLH